MKPRTLAILVVLAVIALGAGWYFGIATEPPVDTATDAGRLLFPDLAAHLSDATKVELQHGASTLSIMKDSKTGDWGLAERGFYPIDVAKLHGLLTALTELRLTEKRTADPGEFAKLGLDDPTSKDATSTLVQVMDKSRHPIAAVIAGHSRVRTEGNLPADIYVRRPDESQTWLAEGKLDVDTDALTWLDRDIMDIKPARIASVTVTNGDTQMKLVRAGDKLTMQDPADHAKLDEEHVDDVQRALELLSLEDVRPDKDAPTGDALGTAVFTTDDGLSITATPVKAGSDLWVRFAAAGTDKTAAEAAKLNARLAGWTYEIGSWKQKALIPTMDDLKAAPPAPTPAPAKP